MKATRVLITAPKSGSGKTMITCGLIELLKRRGKSVTSLKCGPDYIDPMFHKQVLGISSGNLDSYFVKEDVIRYLLLEQAKQSDVTIIEGVMGYYDGIAGASLQGSTYEVARITQSPVILIVDGKGASVTLAAVVKGIMEYARDSHIAGVILNRVSKGYYDRISMVIQESCRIPVLGYVEEQSEFQVPSRHLGLIVPEEEGMFENWIARIADAMEKTIDVKKIMEIAHKASEITGNLPQDLEEMIRDAGHKKRVRIAVARDEAFSFYYSENLQLMEKMGAELVFFSPIHDRKLPEGIQGMVLGGGYPELYAKELSQNKTMLLEVKEAGKRLCILAECGGFLYLQNTLEDMEGNSYSMTGVLNGKGIRKEKLSRFGYMECTLKQEGMLRDVASVLKGHEFHYYDCTDNGRDGRAKKPLSHGREYECMVHSKTLLAGFPHFYYYGNPMIVRDFLDACREV